jgi:hypothetical protein
MVSRFSGKEEMMQAIALDSRTKLLSAQLIEYFETGTPPEGLFADDVFCDLTIPHWRLQAQGVDGLVELRRAGHPAAGSVRSRLDETATGFVLEFEERWVDKGTTWYAREIARADVGDEGITQLSVYCTGDWDAAHEDEHRRSVELLRP